MSRNIDRRDLLELGSSAVGAYAAMTVASGAAGAAVVCTTPLAASTFNLAISSTSVELVDGEVVTMLCYATVGSATPRSPGPVLRVTEGDTVSITISNGRPEAHGFEITGVPGSKVTIQPGQTCRVDFVAPIAGTYLYHDATAPGAPSLYRVLGLHGAFIVHPRNGFSRADISKRCITPYSMDRMALTDPVGVVKVSQVFEAFGNTARFPGGKWEPCPLNRDFSYQEKIWIFNEIDPRFNALILPDRINRPRISASDASMRLNFTPRYFTINGRSGYDLANGYDVVIANYIGEPTLIRTICAGVTHHSTHIHGNAIFELAHYMLTNDAFVPPTGSTRTGLAASDIGRPILHTNIWERDAWPTWPMQIRDVLLPLEVPPEIPDWERYESGNADEKFPLKYVMHDHCEMGTTAAGGNYPQGAVTHWELLGPLNGRNTPT
jgi:hypothetical protein